jgi:hypothetical protein
MKEELLGIIDLFKTPVTTFTKKAEERNIKKEAIITGIIAVVVALVTILTTYMGAMKTVNKTFKSLDDYNEKYSWREDITKSEFNELKKEAKEEALEDIEFVGMFFKTALAIVIAIALVAGILFVIAKMVKSPKDYIEMLSMTNSAYIIYLIGFLLNLVFSYIYTPIGLILVAGASVFATIALLTSYRDSIEVEDTNKLVICSSIVITVVVAVLVIIAMNYLKSLLFASRLF